MRTKIIDGKQCQEREVVYSDFGAITKSEKMIAASKSQGEFKTEEGRSNLLKDVNYSWDKDTNPFDYSETDRNFSDSYENEGLFLADQNEEIEEVKDTEYSAGTLPTRLIILKRPLHIQLKDLYREHARFYKSKSKNLKEKELDLLMSDFRFELHRIIALGKDLVVDGGGNMDTILKASSIGGGPQLSTALRQLTILFKRIEVAYEKYGFIPRNYQTKLNDALSILVSHFVLDVYGPEIERRKTGSNEATNLSQLK